MAFGSMDWLEMGGEWWFYYAGWDGDHGGKDRRPGIGLAIGRKEGLVSMRGPRGGGVVVTRLLKWPGGDLVINAVASAGEIKIRASDAHRKVIPGFDYTDAKPFQGDSLSQVMRWKDHAMDELTGQDIRLEFFLQDADLFTFRATGKE